jgi:VanZ family protein
MKSLFVLAAVLIAYGSFYPFDFQPHARPLRILVESWGMGRGDLLGNIALFLPYGYLGMVAWRRPRGPLRFLIVVLTAALYGAALQCLQLYLPRRDAALRDAIPNTIGAAAGALAGSIPFLDVRRLSEHKGLRAAPWVIIAFWLGYRLVPFVPSINLQEWKESLKPLRDEWGRLSWVDVLHDATAWASVACLWAAAPLGRVTPRWLFLLVGATFSAEVVIVDNVVSPNNFVGAGAGLLLWAVVARIPRREAAVALLLAASVVLSRLSPFEPSPAPRTFHWLPFAGFLGGDMFQNTSSFFEKVFLSGTLVWVAREAGLRLLWAGLATAALLGAIEACQTRLLGHTPEVTDPLLALLAALFVAVADRGAPASPAHPLESDAARRKEES